MKLKHSSFMHTEAGSSDDWSKLLSSHPRNRFLRRLINQLSALDENKHLIRYTL